MIQVEKRLVVAILYAQGHTFKLLDGSPLKHDQINVRLREHVFSFLAIVNDFAQPVIVSRAGFVIVPLVEPFEEEVKFLVEGDIEANTLSEQIAVV